MFAVLKTVAVGGPLVFGAAYLLWLNPAAFALRVAYAICLLVLLALSAFAGDAIIDGIKWLAGWRARKARKVEIALTGSCNGGCPTCGYEYVICQRVKCGFSFRLKP